MQTMTATTVKKNFEETAYLSQNPKMKKKILKGLKTPVSECTPESEINF